MSTTTADAAGPPDVEARAPTRVVRDYLNDSRVWAAFLAQGGFVEGDIVVADPFKAGTTWTQNILQQILTTNGQGEEEEADDENAKNASSLSQTSPWLDSSWGDHAAMLATLAAQAAAGRRRVIKSHLPADAMPIDPRAKYIFVARNGKDLGLSFHNYLSKFTPETLATINALYRSWKGPDAPALSIPADDPAGFLARWIGEEKEEGGGRGAGCCDLLGITASWWALRDRPNVLLLHYSEMLRDLPGTVRRLAAFLGLGEQLDDAAVARAVERSGFEFMKGHAGSVVPFGGAHMTDAAAFFAKGPDRDFRQEMPPALIAQFDRAAAAALEPACCRWLETGAMVEEEEEEEEE